MKTFLVFLSILFSFGEAFAHPMPSSVVHLSVLQKSIQGEAKIPLIELANAVGEERTANIKDPFFRAYFAEHIQAISGNSRWSTQIEDISTITGKDPMVGSYKEAVVQFSLTPQNGKDLRTFTFKYDAVMHQVVTHSALVYIQQDWDNGIQDEKDAQQIGIIQMDVPSGKLFPLQVNLEQGSWWKGFKSMLNLGMQHIKEGTDHLLFLIVLLLPAMLLTNGKRWSHYGGFKYSITHLLKIVTAFTIGHSITLLLGALGWVKLPGQPVEITIAASILVSAIHAIRPIFPGKEALIAAGFGLIHGLAFATVLSRLQLSGTRLALSILGFNVGIELMQLFIIAMIVPWLILLSKTTSYKWFCITAAALSAIASVAWIVQKITGTANFLTNLVEVAARYGEWVIVGLVIVSIALYSARFITNKKRWLVS